MSWTTLLDPLFSFSTLQKLRRPFGLSCYDSLDRSPYFQSWVDWIRMSMHEISCQGLDWTGLVRKNLRVIGTSTEASGERLQRVAEKSKGVSEHGAHRGESGAKNSRELFYDRPFHNFDVVPWGVLSVRYLNVSSGPDSQVGSKLFPNFTKNLSLMALVTHALKLVSKYFQTSNERNLTRIRC